MYVRELESMLNLTDGGEDELPLPSFDGVMKAMQIVEAARNSSDAGGSSVGLEDA
jgi:hypothetical protein